MDNVNEQLNQVIASLEKSIADQEKQIQDLSFDLKVKKAKLKKIKTATEE